MVYSYYEAGRMIVQEEQDGKERASYGKYILREFNPYNLEFFVAIFYDVPQQNHVEKMIELFENAGLILRNDLTGTCYLY